MFDTPSTGYTPTSTTSTTTKASAPTFASSSVSRTSGGTLSTARAGYSGTILTSNDLNTRPTTRKSLLGE
jgi:hypothetical protein